MKREGTCKYINKWGVEFKGVWPIMLGLEREKN